MPEKPFQREPDGARLKFRGMNTMMPPDQMPPGKYPYAQNVRAYLGDRIMGRTTLDSSVGSLAPQPLRSLRRMNDTTPAGPPSGFVLIGMGSSLLYVDNTPVSSAFSGNPVSLVPFRPNASPQPWMYVADSLKMVKVRSDATVYKMGIKEPQDAPTIASTPASGIVSLAGPVTVTYWGDSPHEGTGLIANYIWKNASDPGGAGPIRTSTPANGSTTGNSLLWDVIPGHQESPMAWTVYTEYQGTVDTSGTTVTWDTGSQFGGLAAGDTMVIAGNAYTIVGTPTNTTAVVTPGAGSQVGVNYNAAAISGSTPLFVPALESEGYSDFNWVGEATLFIPAAGTYTFDLLSKDEVIWGIGDNGDGHATWAPPSGGQVVSLNGQTKTAINGYRLLPKTVTDDGGGQHDTAAIPVTFSAPGNYPIEINYDYYFHSGRTLTIKCNGQNIPPIPGSVITSAQYRYVYRSSATGALSNPSPPSPSSPLSVLVNTVQATMSADPQVDKIDFYRLDAALGNYTYVGTGPNSNAPFIDSLLDVDVAGNPILEFDNFEPFPSIALPVGGRVDVINGVVHYVSGDQFNIRWLPGTIIVIGRVAYTLDKRPLSAGLLTASNANLTNGVETVSPPPDGTNLVYSIQEPDLAAQPMPYMWGPTDNINFAFACGDPLRPGVLYWCKGGNLDSAPDTNQQDVTSPSEPLQNGVLTSGFGMVFSTERAWLILPNFFNAQATAEGTEGSTWTLQASNLARGLYIPRCLAVDGSGNVFFRAKDGIYKSPGGFGEKSITDKDIFNLFPHEGNEPAPIKIGIYTVYPPNDSLPEFQQLNIAQGYLYYDYRDLTGTARTLVYDIANDAWNVDEYFDPVLLHYFEEGVVNEVLCGLQNGDIRPMTRVGVETCRSVVLMPSFNAGDTRNLKQWGDIYIEVNAPEYLALLPYTALYTQLVPFDRWTVTPSNAQGRTAIVVDFESEDTGGLFARDLGTDFNWWTNSGVELYVWQPSVIEQPENVYGRPTDWIDGGTDGAKFVQGITLQANTFGQPKTFQLQSSDDGSLHTLFEVPATFNGQSIQAFSCAPFVAHSVRIVSTDGVPWQVWNQNLVFQPWPEACLDWHTEKNSFGLIGWNHAREMNIAYLSTGVITCVLSFDAWPDITFLLPSSGGLQAKTKVTLPPNKWKLMGLHISSPALFNLFQSDLQLKVKEWGSEGPYQVLRPFGGKSSTGALV